MPLDLVLNIKNLGGGMYLNLPISLLWFVSYFKGFSCSEIALKVLKPSGIYFVQSEVRQGYCED